MSYAELATMDGALYVLCGDENDPEHVHAVQAGWESFQGYYWFGIEEVNPKTHEPEEGTGYWFGLVQGLEEELGYFSEAQLEPLMKKGQAWPIQEQDLPHAGRRDEAS